MTTMKFKRMPAPTPEMIRKQRAAAKLSNAQAAKLCQVSPRTFASWASGGARMHPIFWAWFLETSDLSKGAT